MRTHTRNLRVAARIAVPARVTRQAELATSKGFGGVVRALGLVQLPEVFVPLRQFARAVLVFDEQARRSGHNTDPGYRQITQ